MVRIYIDNSEVYRYSHKYKRKRDGKNAKNNHCNHVHV